MITIEQISHYLPYGLKAILTKDQHDYFDPEIDVDEEKFNKGSVWQYAGYADGDLMIPAGEGELDGFIFRNNTAWASGLHGVKPILYPITALTTPISHKGETFVPLLELAKIAYTESKWKMTQEGNKAIDNIGGLFYFDDGCFYLDANAQLRFEGVPNQLLLFRKCYEWKINLEGIESVDPESLDMNPYE